MIEPKSFGVGALTALLAALVGCGPTSPPSSVQEESDVVVVGAGVAGLSAALEAGRRGARVTVLDMWSVFGGHSVMAGGAVLIVDTPLQRSQGIQDSAELAVQDFMTWGDDADPGWVQYYAAHSREELYEWVTPMGVRFHSVGRFYGSSVPRLHRTEDYGLGLVSPIYLQAAQTPSVRFVWNFRVDGLVIEGGAVRGVRGVGTRDGLQKVFPAKAVIVATGGFQSNLDLVREHWPRDLPFPQRILAGSGVNSQGLGLELTRSSGADTHRLDHQWNYSTGLPDPRFPGGDRGVSAGSSRSLWVNRRGMRFVDETASEKYRFPIVLEQEGSTYWAVFDDNDKSFFNVSGAGWEDFDLRNRLILDNPWLTVKAPTLELLADGIGAPAQALTETVRRFNDFLARGVDEDFNRFSSRRAQPWRIDRPPFYAVQFFPLARKSMGGVRVDLSCRALGQNGGPIPGLYVVGEAAGFGGLNGRAALEGTFLGPSIVMGRAAGRAASHGFVEKPFAVLAAQTAPDAGFADEVCRPCHDMPTLLKSPRPGFRHFELVHERTAKDEIPCRRCHAEMHPYRELDHRSLPAGQVESCRVCHLSRE